MMEIYNQVRAVPKEAQKPISAGRLKGMTDVNPMWRIQKLTEVFGACGFGWYYNIDKEWVSELNGEAIANVEISLFVKQDDWSMPIKGVGGSMIMAKEKNGIHVNDEAYKMALTDAISVACKALGMAADVYWQQGVTKYNKPMTNREKLIEFAKQTNYPLSELAKDFGITKDTTEDRYADILYELENEN